ncbi:hypothetical protein [Rubrivirga sp. IMCC45206]|uniref:hypothetical protein n=1 Tax=Rubrivirga sp. IMCC45206 TaxID=3391614 RepID=UPI00398FA090
MATVSFFAFVFAALMGLTMAVRHWRGQTSGKAFGIVHGLWALAGIALLASSLAQRDAGWGWWVLASFGVVALGGLYQFSKQVRGQKWSEVVLWAHGGLALVTLAALGVWLFARPEPQSAPGAPAGTTENLPIDASAP